TQAGVNTANQIGFNAALTVIGTGVPILSGVFVNDSNAVNGQTFKLASFLAGVGTLGTTNTVVALTAYQALSTTGANTAADNVLVTASTAMTAVSDTVNSMLIVGNGINVSGATTNLTVA